MKTYITGVWSRVRGIQSGAFTHSSRICKGSQARWQLKTKCSSSTHPVTLSMACGRDAQLVMDRMCKPGIVWWYKCYSQFDYSTLQKHYPQLQNSKITLKTQMTIVAFCPLMIVFYIESENKVMALCSENACNIYHVYISHM